MTDLQIIKLIENEIEYNKEMFNSAKQLGLGNRYCTEYINKNDVLYLILDKIKEQISIELEEQCKEVKKND